MKIKELEWIADGEGTYTAEISLSEISAIDFLIDWDSEYMTYFVQFNDGDIGNFDTLDEAKAFCQQHWESIIKQWVIE